MLWLRGWSNSASLLAQTMPHMLMPACAVKMSCHGVRTRPVNGKGNRYRLHTTERNISQSSSDTLFDTNDLVRARRRIEVQMRTRDVIRRTNSLTPRGSISWAMIVAAS